MNAKMWMTSLLVAITAIAGATFIGDLRGQDAIDGAVDETPIEGSATLEVEFGEGDEVDQPAAHRVQVGQGMPRGAIRWAPRDDEPKGVLFMDARATIQPRPPSFVQQLSAAKKTLSSPSASDAQKTEAEQRIQSLLDKYFDEDFKRRQAKISELKQRVEQLTMQLEKRRAAKRDLIELQMQVIKNEAAGLGFFTADDVKTAFDAVALPGVSEVLNSNLSSPFNPSAADPFKPSAAVSK